MSSENIKNINTTYRINLYIFDICAHKIISAHFKMLTLIAMRWWQFYILFLPLSLFLYFQIFYYIFKFSIIYYVFQISIMHCF